MAESLRTLVLAVTLLGSVSSAIAAAPQTSTFANVQVVSVDPARRTIIVRSGAGPARSYPLDDLLAGTGDTRAGDQVIITLVGGAGRQRVAAISKLPARPATARAQAPPARARTAGADRASVRARFADQVSALSLNARSVDSMWSSFVTACDVKPVANEGGGRDWFGLWDGRVQADYSGGFCRDLFNQIVSAGEGVKKGMAAAEASVRNDLTPGDIREIRTLHAMNWDGWSLPAPPRREP